MNQREAGEFIQLGKSYRGQGLWSEAEAALKEALRIAPQDVRAYVELGALYIDQGRSTEAEAEFKKAIAIDPRNSGAYFDLGRIYAGQGRAAEAEAALKNALAIDPRIAGACVELGRLYKDQERFPEAEAALQKAIAVDPRNGGAHFQLGNVCRRQGRWPEAEAEFKQAIAIDPSNDRAYLGLRAIYRSQGRAAEADAASQAALAMSPRNAWACAGSRQRQERHEDAGAVAELPRDQTFCLLPWTHLHVRADGSFRPCCSWSGPPLGNTLSASLSELWNSPGMKALRLDMMNGRWAAGCERCHEKEQADFLSVRQDKNAFLGRHRGRESLTAPDGSLPQLPILYLDFRFSNVCNLRCRICEPTQSSAWMSDARSLGLPVKGGPVQKPYDDWDSLWRQLRPLLEDGLVEILFAGGEPLIMEEHYRILDFLISRGLTDVRLNYNTNFSTLRFQGRDVIDLWSRFRNVHVAASLDGSGRRGEYMRKGLSWDAVVANREEMLRRCPEVKFSILATLSIFNAMHLPDLHREWVQKGYIARNEFALSVLVAPEIYRMQVLPPALKQRVLESYRRHQETFLDADGPAAHDFTAAAHFIQAQDRSELLPEFVAMTRRLDQLRGEDCREVFPELAGLFEGAA